MDWLNIHTSTLDGPEFLGADPVQRATWICLLRWCAGQENGGRIEGASGWTDRKWQQLARVTLDEINSQCDLWAWDGDCLVVSFYPVAKEAEVSSKRAGGRAGGCARTDAKTSAAKANGSKGGRPNNPSLSQAEPKDNPSLNPTEGKGKEGKGKEGNAPPSGPETQDGEDLFQQDPPQQTNHQEPQPRQTPPPLSPAPPLPKISPQDLQAACGYALDWFKGNDSGRQEARDELTAALALYPADKIQGWILAEFQDTKQKTHVRDLLAVLARRSTPPPQPTAREIAKAKETEAVRDLIRRAVALRGIDTWKEATRRPNETLEESLAAAAFAGPWAREIIAKHYPEIK